MAMSAQRELITEPYRDACPSFQLNKYFTTYSLLHYGIKFCLGLQLHLQV